ENTREPIVIDGIHNILLLGIIVSAVVLNGLMPTIDMFVDPATGACYGFYVFDGVFISINYLAQITLILLAAFLSMKMTKKSTREHNEFTFGPIIEVATLFIGIFLTMIPALALLRAHGAELGLDAPWQFFWFAGALSSFLDNTPTYLVFLTIAGSLGATQGVATTVGTVAVANLFAISAGAVFMGANTYIGNAPNFIVKSIAEENKIKMPSFFGYMLWSICILIPVFIIDTFVFFL
ncbi:MAG: sodium:proton antiporter, partial [Actinobacteria bacterium]|nr:sodium:proton antiporter [Actinomycetota bacterium]